MPLRSHMVGHQNKQNIIIIFVSQQLNSCSERTHARVPKYHQLQPQTSAAQSAT